METIELIIDETKKTDCVFAISLVEYPAIEKDFVALSKNKVLLKTINEDKRIVIGLALVPDKEIPRKTKDKEYNIKFSKETVKKASYLYLKRLYNNNTTVEHKRGVKGVSVVESWIVEDPKKDKTALYNLDADEGSWAVIMKIDNKKVWKGVKNGNYLGLSIEGSFSEKNDLSRADLSKIDKKSDAEILKEIKNILTQ